MMIKHVWRRAQRLLSYRCPDCNYYYCECSRRKKMKSSHRLKSAVSALKKKEKKMVKTKHSVSTRKPLNLNCSLIEKSLMCGLLNGQPIAEPNYHFKIGDNYDEKRISTLQSNKVQHRCKDSNSKNWQSLQVQYQLSYNLDSKIQTKSVTRQGGRSA